jgi:hypothetical protein
MPDQIRGPGEIHRFTRDEFGPPAVSVLTEAALEAALE